MKKKVSIAILVVMVLTLSLALAACSDKEIVISFNTGNGSTVDDITFIKGETPSLNDVKPIKAGYKFVGWYFDEAFTKPYNKDAVPNKSFTLYAKYNELRKFKISFETNGGTPILDKEFIEDKVPNISGAMTTKTDYEFAGWYLDSALKTKYVAEPITKNLKLYAKWVESEYSVVTFESNGGESIPDLVFKRTEKPDLSKYIPYRNKHIFLGWYFDEELTKPYVKEEAPDHSFSVYAKFEFKKDTSDFINSLKASLATYDLDKGFNAKFDGKIKFMHQNQLNIESNFEYGFIVEGNFFNENLDGNNNLQIKIVDKKNNNALLLGIKNINNDLVIETNGASYKVSGFNIQTLLTQVLQTSLLPSGSNLGNLNITKDMTIDDAIDYLQLAMSFLDSKISVDWNDNVYVIDMEVGETLKAAVDLIEGIGIKLPQEIHQLIDRLLVDKVALEFTITENSDAIFVDLITDVKLDTTNENINGVFTAGSNFDIGKIDANFTPVIEGNVININLFEHSLSTDFTMQDVEGNVLGTYKFNMMMEFSQDTLQSSIIKAIQTKDFYPLVSDIINQKNGKIYIDLYHVCDSTCKLEHLGKAEGNHGSVLSIAFDPSLEGFNNNKIYVAINLKMLATQKLLDIIPNGLGALLKPVIAPKDMGYLGLSLDIDNLIKMNSLAPLPSMPNEGGGEGNPGGGSTLNTIESIIRVLKVASKSLVVSENTWNVDYLSIWNAIQAELPQGSKELITGVVNGLMPNVAKVVGTNASYKNSSSIPEDFNVAQEFMKKNPSGEEKIFKAGGILEKDAVTLIKGEDPQVVLENGKAKINTKYDIYDSEGNIVVNLAELHLLRQELPTIDITYTDIKDQVVNSKGMIYDIRGLDVNKIDVPQTVTLVIGRGVGDNLWSVLGQIGNLLNVEALKTIALPQTFYDIEITLSNVASTTWTQDGVASPERAFDPEKIYTYEDTFNTQLYNVRTYSNGVVKKALVCTTSTDKVTSVEANMSQINYYSDFDLYYEYLDTKYAMHVNVADYSFVKELNYTANKKANLPDNIVVDTLGGKKIALSAANDYLVSMLTNFANNSNGKVKFAVEGVLFKKLALTFAETGNYELILNLNGLDLTLKFIVA